jgi:hypothetical protein
MIAPQGQVCTFKGRHLEAMSGAGEDRRGGGGADVGRGPLWPPAVLAMSPTLPQAGGHKGPSQPHTTPAPTATTSLYKCLPLKGGPAGARFIAPRSDTDRKTFHT